MTEREVEIVRCDGGEIDITEKEISDIASGIKEGFPEKISMKDKSESMYDKTYITRTYGRSHITYKDVDYMDKNAPVFTFTKDGVTISRCDGGKVDITEKELCDLADGEYFPKKMQSLKSMMGKSEDKPSRQRGEGIIMYKDVAYDYLCE